MPAMRLSTRDYYRLAYLSNATLAPPWHVAPHTGLRLLDGLGSLPNWQVSLHASLRQKESQYRPFLVFLARAVLRELHLSWIAFFLARVEKNRNIRALVSPTKLSRQIEAPSHTRRGTPFASNETRMLIIFDR